ncbi:MAG TPA: hypothetical protein VGJ22_07205, partial [Anaerolineales bacterium]
LQAFLGSLTTIGFLLVLGVAGLGSALLRRNDGKLARSAMGAAGGFLLLVGVVMTLLTLRTMTAGSATVTALLNDKIIAEDSCGDNSTCSRYVLEMRSSTKSYDVQVDASAYERAQVNSCYQVNYYPGRGLMGASQAVDSYEYVSNVTRVEALPASECQ